MINTIIISNPQEISPTVSAFMAARETTVSQMLEDKCSDMVITSPHLVIIIFIIIIVISIIFNFHHIIIFFFLIMVTKVMDESMLTSLLDSTKLQMLKVIVLFQHQNRKIVSSLGTCSEKDSSHFN